MTLTLRDNWYHRTEDPSINMDAAGVYQWTIEGRGVYVGKAKVLRKRLPAYPRNVLAMLQGRHWHGNPAKKYRAIHEALREACDLGKSVTVTVLENCDASVRAQRERHWIKLRHIEAEKPGGLPVLNSD
jgi:hypothetical protein